MSEGAANLDETNSYGLPFTLGNDDRTHATCIISRATTLRGDISCEAEIRVSGTVEGELVSATRVLVVAGAQVRGRVTAPEVIVSGLVIGEVVAEQSLTVRSTGEVRGTVVAGTLGLEQGGTVAARCEVPHQLVQPS